MSMSQSIGKCQKTRWLHKNKRTCPPPTAAKGKKIEQKNKNIIVCNLHQRSTYVVTVHIGRDVI